VQGALFTMSMSGVGIARSCCVVQAWHITVVALVLVGGVNFNLIPLDHPWPDV
jgi:hypothetical protein